jgi:hypothetical protein
MGARLMAIVAEGAGDRVYLAPTEAMETAARAAEPSWKPEAPSRGTWASNAQGRRYGFRMFGDYFTPRQLVALTTFSDLVQEARARVNAGLGEASPNFDALLTRLLGLGYADRDRIDEVCRILEIDVAAWSLEHRPYMSRAQLAQLHADGFTLGGHTIDHPRLARLDSASSRREQIVGSCRWVAELTGRDRVPFAFPFNGVRVDRDELSDVREESGVIDLIYDTNDLMKDRDFIVNRIWGDTPVGGDALNSNLPGLLRRAYLFEPVRGMKRRLRSLRT